ncbi:MAG: hypothetical protein ACRETW_07065 [Stenotrophobium sp.]
MSTDKKLETEMVPIPGAVSNGAVWAIERLAVQSILDHAEQSPPLPAREGRRLCVWPDNVFAMVPDHADADELIEAYRDAWYLCSVRKALHDLRVMQWLQDGETPPGKPA